MLETTNIQSFYLLTQKEVKHDIYYLQNLNRTFIFIFSLNKFQSTTR